jgi:hypothetical protein
MTHMQLGYAALSKSTLDLDRIISPAGIKNVRRNDDQEDFGFVTAAKRYMSLWIAASVLLPRDSAFRAARPDNE